MLAFSQQGNGGQPELGAATNHQLDGDDLRAAIFDLTAGNGSIQDVLQGYIAGTTSAEEAATTVHAALREAGHQVSRKAVEAALEAIAAELQPPQEPEPTPEPSAEATEASTEVMHVVDLLEELDRLGVQLRCGRREDRLHVTPRDSLEAKHVAAIRSWKKEIIQLLRDHELEVTGVLQDERQVFEEFRRVRAAREAR